MRRLLLVGLMLWLLADGDPARAREAGPAGEPHTLHGIITQPGTNQAVNFGLAAGTHRPELHYTLSTATAIGSPDGPVYHLRSRRHYVLASLRVPEPLDLELTGFVAQSDNQRVYLAWQVASGSEAQEFIVERSFNGTPWYPLGTLARAGEQYRFVDASPQVGVNFYRLRAQGHEKTAYSFSRRVYVARIDNFIPVYPNPVRGSLRFQLTALPAGMYRAMVITASGQRIVAATIRHDGTDQYVTLALPAYCTRGIYWLVLAKKNEFYRESFLVE
ncbi:MAG TPA: hypothetical protein VG870_02090 [Chitinophagaceae bacterium]|nr:hypothetical protein [Chitinophagaceae bacterium]